MAKAFIPVPIIDSILISSTITEPGTGEDAYNAGTTYALDDTVSVITTDSHLTYKSLQGSNTGNTPDPDEDTAWWQRTFNTNRWKMFDYLRSEQSTDTTQITVVLAPSQRVSAVFVGNMEGAEQIVITVRDGGVSGDIVYTETKDLESRNALTHYEFAFAPFVYDGSFASFSLPATLDPYITIDITGTASMSIGGLAIGQALELGCTLFSPLITTKNFSEIETDDFGNLTLTPRKTVPNIDQTISIDADRTSRLLRLSQDANAAPIVWSSMDDSDQPYYRPTLILGYYRKFEINLDTITKAKLFLDIRGI